MITGWVVLTSRDESGAVYTDANTGRLALKAIWWGGGGVPFRKCDWSVVASKVIAWVVDVHGALAIAKIWSGTDDDYSIHVDVGCTVVDVGRVVTGSYVCMA